MRKSIFTIFILLLSTTLTNAQVGIGTTSPNGSAQLDVNSTNKGFLPPRMTSAQRGNITSPVAGLMVYQTDGTAGLYYYNGSAWIYIINATNNTLPVANGGTGVTTSTGTGNAVLSTSPTLTTPTISSGNIQYPSSLSISPTTHATSKRAAIWIDGWSLLQDINGNGTKNFAIGQTVAGPSYPNRLFISTDGNIGMGNTAPNARLDIRTNPTSTSDPGAGYFGIGTAASTAANTAGAGAVRYSTASGGVLEYSNGNNWNTLVGNVSKAIAIATKTTSQTINDQTPTDITDWTEVTDNADAFNPTTGEFTAPRTGNYVFNFSYAFTNSAYPNVNNLNIEAWMSCSNNTKLRKQLLAAPVNTSTRCGALISFVVNLNAGETIRPSIWHATGASTRSLESGFNNLSIVEL
jgi:hypothetical protein